MPPESSSRTFTAAIVVDVVEVDLATVLEGVEDDAVAGVVVDAAGATVVGVAARVVGATVGAAVGAGVAGGAVVTGAAVVVIVGAGSSDPGGPIQRAGGCPSS